MSSHPFDNDFEITPSTRSNSGATAGGIWGC